MTHEHDEAVDRDLAALAQAYGVATEYLDQRGLLVTVHAQTVRAVLTALGLDVSGPQEIAGALAEKRTRNWRRMLPPVFVMRAGTEQRLWVHVRHGHPAAAWVRTEAGDHVDLAQIDHWTDPVDVDGELVGEASFRLPGDLPLGWHTIHAHSDDRIATTPLVVAPTRLEPQELCGERQWGLMTQVYAARSRSSWGLGDLRDLADLAAWSAAEHGAGFVLVNPLHAAEPVPPMEPSPYLPVTRRFANPLYLRIEDVPEYERLMPAVRAEVDRLADRMRRRSATGDLLDRDAVWSAKRVALEAIHRVERTPERAAAYARFCAREGSGLEAFARWCAIRDVHGEPSTWPADLGSASAPGVSRFADEHSDRVDFHRWLQWLLDEQLEQAHGAAVSAGMALGIVHDLAVGVHPEGSDAWAMADVLVRGVGVGAPPDMYNQQGQNWSQPPWHPDALAEAGFVPFRDQLRTVLAHAGGIRVDHVLGLFRLWWIPDGLPAYAGTYVRYDHEAMLAILMLEAQRAGAVVIGEDLGTVEPWVAHALADRGILGTSILWFEAMSGQIVPPARWRREVLASVTVHDLPPTAGYLRDEHVRIRTELGLLARSQEQELRASAAERAAWLQLLEESGWLAPGVDLDTQAGLDTVVIALHRALAASPARLLGIGLPDCVGDRRAQNQPGTCDEYPNWRLPLAGPDAEPVLLEDLMSGSDLLAGILDAIRARADDGGDGRLNG